MSYFDSHHLLTKHKTYLNMGRWSDPSSAPVTSVPAQRCLRNNGIIRKDSTEYPSQHNIYIDNTLMVDIKQRLAIALVAAIKAIFTITGVPNLLLRPYLMTIDKWINLNVNAV